MSYCLNPSCPNPADAGNTNNRICRNCGSELLIQDRYQVMRLISAKSGFGKIYDAYEGATPKILKVLKEDFNRNPKAVELFKQEATVLSQLHHPGIPKVEPDGYFQFTPRNNPESLHCLIMEKIDGLNLKQWMNQQGNHPISEQQALKWLTQLAEILHLVHKKNYFHRDIKPENIMIRSNGQLVLIDFGTVREVTQTYLQKMTGQQITGIFSPGYTPAEQLHGEAVPQSDFYALGRTFVYLLTGLELTDQHIYDPLNNEFKWRNYANHISPQLADFIDKLMAPQAAARHQNTEEILNDLARKFPGGLNQRDSLMFGVTSNGHYSEAQAFATTSLPTPNVIRLINTVLRDRNQSVFKGAIALFIILSAAGSWQLFHFYNLKDNPKENITLANTLTGHSSYINYLVISPDSQTLISASADKTIKIWNLATGKEIRTLMGHLGYVNYLVISPDGQTLFSASADKTIKVWDLATGKKTKTLTGHSSYVNYLAISPDGQTLVSASADKTIKIWDIVNGKEIKTISGHANFVNCLAINSDGQILASAGADKNIKIWQLATGKEIRTFTGHSSYVNWVTFSSDGQTLVSASADKTIKVWNYLTGKEIRTLQGHSNYVNSVAISPDGEKLISASADKTIKIWNLVNGEEINTLTKSNNYIKYMAVSPDWHTIVTGSGDNNIMIWRINK